MIDPALPVVDVHCHPFTRHETLTSEQFLGLIAFPGGDADFLAAGGADRAAAASEVFDSRRNTLFVRYAVHQLAAFFGCEPSIEQIVAARNLRSQEDFRGYVEALFSACGLTALVTDFGYPKPPLDISLFRSYTPVEVIPIYRIETFIDAWAGKDIGWEEFSAQYERALTGALESGYCGLKSIIAYRTGLDISPESRSPGQGERAWAALRGGADAHKALRDHLLCRAMEICIEYGVPMQIHTGIGDYEVNLTNCRPALLMDLLRSPAFRTCKVLLVHGGYPYHSEAGYMANVLPRVYCGVSEGIPFAAHAARRIFSEVLEMAPIMKVLYGSDGYVLPEIAYLGAVLGKRALAEALEDITASGMLSRSEAQEAAGLILAGNARRLYGLTRE